MILLYINFFQSKKKKKINKRALIFLITMCINYSVSIFINKTFFFFL